MDAEDRSTKCRIWLIGDSPPKNWHDKLKVPLDSRHPARHNIWTSVLDMIQETVFHDGLRLDSERIYVRNAVDSPTLIDPERVQWNWAELAPAVTKLGELLADNRPPLVLSFGAFACEMVCRARRKYLAGPGEDRAVNGWTTKQLGDAFRRAVNAYDSSGVNHLPLLHVSIARRHFLSAHKHFCPPSDQPNYFEYVGRELGELLLKHMKDEPIWLRPGGSATESGPK